MIPQVRQPEAQCRYTTRLLKRFASFDLLVADYFDHNKTSPFVEELSVGFLAHYAHKKIHWFVPYRNLNLRFLGSALVLHRFTKFCGIDTPSTS